MTNLIMHAQILIYSSNAVAAWVHKAIENYATERPYSYHSFLS